MMARAFVFASRTVGCSHLLLERPTIALFIGIVLHSRAKGLHRLRNLVLSHVNEPHVFVPLDEPRIKPQGLLNLPGSLRYLSSLCENES